MRLTVSVRAASCKDIVPAGESAAEEANTKYDRVQSAGRMSSTPCRASNVCQVSFLMKHIQNIQTPFLYLCRKRFEVETDKRYIIFNSGFAVVHKARAPLIINVSYIKISMHDSIQFDFTDFQKVWNFSKPG